MAVPTNKEELIEAIHTSFLKLQKELEGIPKGITKDKNLVGHAKGTLMSINDLLAYLTRWAELVLKWNHKKDNKEAVDFPETGYQWNQLGTLAQKFYTDYDDLDFDLLVNRLNSSVEEILKLIANKSNEELYEISWYKKWTLGRMIQFNTSSPYANARGRIRKWKKEQHLN